MKTVNKRTRSRIVANKHSWIARACLGALLAACVWPALAERVRVPELVRFPSLDTWQGQAPLMLDGYFFSSPQAQPSAAVVLLHGCAGALSAKTGRLTGRFTQMASLLNEMGYAVMVVDSFNPRGVPEICTTPIVDRDIRNHHRLLDAYGALQYLNGRADIVSGKVAALGFSHGGSGALSVMDASAAAYKRSTAHFAAAVALYPGCAWQESKKPVFRAYGPLLILAGEADDWTPVAPCRKLAARSQSKGEPVELIVYPDAHHGFDQTTPVRLRTDVTHGVNGAAGVHVGGNPQARQAAYQRIREFFQQHLQP